MSCTCCFTIILWSPPPCPKPPSVIRRKVEGEDRTERRAAACDAAIRISATDPFPAFAHVARPFSVGLMICATSGLQRLFALQLARKSQVARRLASTFVAGRDWATKPPAIANVCISAAFSDRRWLASAEGHHRLEGSVEVGNDPAAVELDDGFVQGARRCRQAR